VIHIQEAFPGNSEEQPESACTGQPLTLAKVSNICRIETMLLFAAIFTILYGIVLFAVFFFSGSDLKTNIEAGVLVIPLEILGLALLFQAILERRDERRDHLMWMTVRRQALYSMARLLQDFDDIVYDLEETLDWPTNPQDPKLALDFVWLRWQTRFGEWREEMQLLSPGFSPTLAGATVKFVRGTRSLQEVFVVFYETLRLQPPHLRGGFVDEATDLDIQRKIKEHGYNYGRLKCRQVLLRIVETLGEQTVEKDDGAFLVLGDERTRISFEDDYFEKTVAGIVVMLEKKA
jgi:hypothetical protein